jgi:hypothetical protein
MTRRNGRDSPEHRPSHLPPSDAVVSARSSQPAHRAPHRCARAHRPPPCAAAADRARLRKRNTAKNATTRLHVLFRARAPPASHRRRRRLRRSRHRRRCSCCAGRRPLAVGRAACRGADRAGTGEFWVRFGLFVAHRGSAGVFRAAHARGAQHLRGAEPAGRHPGRRRGGRGGGRVWALARARAHVRALRGGMAPHRCSPGAPHPQRARPACAARVRCVSRGRGARRGARETLSKPNCSRSVLRFRRLSTPARRAHTVCFHALRRPPADGRGRGLRAQHRAGLRGGDRAAKVRARLSRAAPRAVRAPRPVSAHAKTRGRRVCAALLLRLRAPAPPRAAPRHTPRTLPARRLPTQHMAQRATPHTDTRTNTHVSSRHCPPALSARLLAACAAV